MIERLVHTLNSAGCELTAREIAEVLWLAPKIGSGKFSENLSAFGDSPAENQARSSQETVNEKSGGDQSSSQSGTSRSKANKLGAEHQGGLYSASTDISGEASGSGIPFRVPAASALPGKLGIARALRPFSRKVSSNVDFALDEAASVQRIAETNIWQPVLQPAKVRWLDVALIVDRSASMVIWQQTITELRQMLAGHGAFRDIRTWSIVTDAEDEQVHLYTGISPTVERHPRELIDPQGRRLFLIISDCVSPAWRNGSVGQMIATWGQKNPVTIVQVLPQRLWIRSALGQATAASMRTMLPAAPNYQMEAVALPGQWLEEDALVGIAVPVVTLEPEPIAAWARASSGMDSAWTSGVVLALDEYSLNDARTKADAATEGVEPPRKCAQRFRSTASPTARKLAAYLAAAAPLNLQVMRLVQRSMLPQSRQVHLAEVFLGGVLEQITSEDETTDPEQIQYDFIAGVREELLNSVAVGDALDVLGLVYDHLVQQTSTFIEERAGHPIDFAAWLATLTDTGSVDVNGVGQPFARVTATVLHRLGGEYAKIADDLAEQLALIEPMTDGPVEEMHSTGIDNQDEVTDSTRHISEQDLSAALAATLPVKFHSDIPVLAQVLTAAWDGQPASVSTENLQAALHALQGKTLHFAGGDITVGEVTGEGIAVGHNLIRVYVPRTAEQKQGFRNRSRMLEKVRTYWIEGFLQQSLHKIALVELGMQYYPDALEYPWEMFVTSPDRPSTAVPPGTSIADVFDEFGGELLILGSPGTGKTTMLLELARTLIERAQQDETHAIPVVFNLSSWAVKRPPLANWLVEELNTRYDLPLKVAKGWIENDQVLPLLDGLDEVESAHRRACIAAINAYREQHGLTGIVVCSRIPDYGALTKKLRLQGAVLLQPLTEQQIEDALKQVGDKANTIRRVLRQLRVTAQPYNNAEVEELTRTPLLLSITTLAYQGYTDTELPPPNAQPAEHLRHLFATYVDRMFKRRGVSAKYTPEQTKHWLSWIANYLTEHQATIFYPEKLGVVQRFSLVRSGYLPWDYRRFLDYATERLFLRKFGDGYIFVHRLLLEYFASSADRKG